MDSREKTARRAGYGFFLIFIVLAAGLALVGLFFYRNFERRYRAGVERQLLAVAQLKVDELVSWRSAQEREAAIFFKNASFTALVRRFFENPEDAAARDRLWAWLSHFQAANYDRVFLLDPLGRERISAPDMPNPVPSYLPEEAADILRSARITFVDIHRDAPDSPIHLSILVPILDEGGGDRAVGILVLRIDPSKYLYPLIQRWPTPSRTAETLLVRREGDEAVFLNELRFLEQPALTLRSPLANTKMPAVQAVLGHEGIIEGLDYRGAAVIACTRAVPNSPWFLITRMDLSEAFGPMRERLWGMIVIFGSLILVAGAGVGLVWRHQRARFYRDLYEAAAAVRESEERYRELIECASDGIFVSDAEGKYVGVNPSGAAMLGYRRDEILSKRISDLIPAEDLAAAPLRLDELRQGKTIITERRLVRKDGTFLQVEISSWMLPDGRFQAIQRDITERKRSEEMLAIKKRIGDIFLTTPGDEMYAEVLKIILGVMESPFGIFGYIDEDGSEVAPSMTRAVWDKCQVAQKAIVFPRETWGDSSWPRAIREKKPNYSNEISAKTPEGHLPIKRHISLPILYQGEVVGLFQVANKETDYTDEDVRLLESIAGYVAPILSTRIERRRHEVKLQEKNDELIRFTYTVSHDLKSPLVTIRTFLGYLEQDIRRPDAAVVEKDLAYIRNAADKASRLLDELLELSRIGRKVNPPVEVPLQEVVNEALDLVAGRIAERRVMVTVTQEPFQLFGDRQRLVEVFQNLVDNAVKFMGQEREPRVEIGVEQVGRETTLFVRDNGIGIDPQFQPKLFGLFEKLDPGTDGTGIGLALVKRIVEVHGGRIWVESEGPGKGTTVRFTLSGKENSRNRGNTKMEEGSRRAGE